MASLTDLMNAASGAQSSYSLAKSFFTADAVRITDMNGVQMFSQCRAMSATISRTSTLAEHPLETGNTIVDFKIIKPNTITLKMIIPDDAYRAVYKEIEQAWLSSATFIVQTWASSFANMVITDLPHDETPDSAGSISLSLTLKEVVWFTSTVETMPAKEVAVSSKSAKKGGEAKPDADTVKQGQKRPANASAATQKKAAFALKPVAGRLI